MDLSYQTCSRCSPIVRDLPSPTTRLNLGASPYVFLSQAGNHRKIDNGARSPLHTISNHGNNEHLHRSKTSSNPPFQKPTHITHDYSIPPSPHSLLLAPPLAASQHACGKVGWAALTYCQKTHPGQNPHPSNANTPSF